MANENTNRRQLYLPKELDEWFINEGKKTGVRVNTIILKALEEYKETHGKKGHKKKSDFEKDVRKVAIALLKEKGLL